MHKLPVDLRKVLIANPAAWLPGGTSRRWRATSSSAGSRTRSKRGRDSAASSGPMRSWKKASAAPAVGLGASPASARVDERPTSVAAAVDRGELVPLRARPRPARYAFGFAYPLSRYVSIEFDEKGTPVPTKSDAVYVVEKGHAKILAKGEDLGHPNGLVWSGAKLWVVTFGTGEIYSLDESGKKGRLAEAS